MRIGMGYFFFPLLLILTLLVSQASVEITEIDGIFTFEGLGLTATGRDDYTPPHGTRWQCTAKGVF